MRAYIKPAVATAVLAALLVVSFGVAASGIALASDDDSDGIEDEVEHNYERDLTFEMVENEIRIESVLRNGVNKNEVDLKISNDSDGISIEMSFSNETHNHTSGDEDEFELEFSVVFHELIEYLDGNGDGVYTSPETIVQTMLIDSFDEVQNSTEILPGNATLHHFIINESSDVFIMHVFFVNEFSIVNGSLITPSSVKIDVEIVNFPMINASANSLALGVRLESGGDDFEIENETEHEHLNITDDSEVGFQTLNSTTDVTGAFTLNQTAIVDDMSVQVNVSAPVVDDDDGSEQKIYITYGNGSVIYHDPKLVVEGIETILTISPGPTSIPGFGTAAVVAATSSAVLVAAVTSRKKRRISA